VAERKSVLGINSEFAVTTDQSCLNRWITEVAWDEQELNDRRLEWLQRASSTRYSAQGVIAIDNTLISHEGKLIEDVGWFWDHATSASDRPRLSDRQLRLHVGQALRARVPPLQEAGGL